MSRTGRATKKSKSRSIKVKIALQNGGYFKYLKIYMAWSAYYFFKPIIPNQS